MKKTVLAGFIHDMAKMEDILQASSLDFTVVRPPGLTDAAKTLDVVVEPDRTQCSRGKYSITRADLASIMLDAVEKNQFLRQFVAVANI